jgi:hypothetical protein
MGMKPRTTPKPVPKPAEEIPPGLAPMSALEDLATARMVDAAKLRALEESNKLLTKRVDALEAELRELWTQLAG